jgi:IclR family KDG regulon transcriptional repressor
MSATKTDAGAGSQTIDRTLRLLVEIGDGGVDGVSLAECSRRLGYSKATALRILRTLERWRLVEGDATTGAYRLGVATLRLGMIYLENLDLRRVALPVLQELARETGETVHLGVLAGSQVVYIEKVDGSHAVRMFSRVGHTMPSHSTGVGKAILAFLPNDILEDTLPADLERFTPTTITDRRDLLAHFDEIRSRGYAIDNVENEEGIACVGAPVFDHTGGVAAAVSVAGPAHRMSADRIAEYGVLARRGALRLSDLLGYRGFTILDEP